MSLEWIGLGPHLYTAVAGGQIDLVLLGVDKSLPDGLMAQEMPTLKRYTFMCNGNPALDNCDQVAWLKWPHVMVGMASAARQTVENKIAQEGLERSIGANLPEFSGVAPLLARTNMLGTSVRPFMARDMEIYDLVA